MPANHSVTLAYHGTLTANTADTVYVGTSGSEFGGNYSAIEVKNRGSDFIYFTVDGTTPTVGGANTYIVGPAESLQVDSPGADIVGLISASATPYSVTGVR